MSGARTAHDDRGIYCRRLGHPLTFRYCRTTAGDTPCSGIANCWFEHFPVVEFLREHCSEPVLEKIGAPPPPKVLTLVDLVERAKRANAGV